MNKVCFIGGIHGVGKTTFCKQLIANLNNFKHLTASEIIKKYKNSDEFDTKRVKDIDKNQLLLVNGLKKEKKNSNILLDGHFVLLDKEDNIKKIDINVFKELDLNCIIILIDNPQNIKNRLDKRGKNTLNIEILKKMQELEIQHGKEIAATLNIPYLEVNFLRNEFPLKIAIDYIQGV